MKQGKIVVVMGGPSSEAKVSRLTGAGIVNALAAKGYEVEGMELDPPHFAADIKKSGCVIVFNALHGKYGEDGILQGTLDMLGIPYTGSGVLAAAVTMDKVMSKRVFLGAGITTPRSKTFHRFEYNANLLPRIRQLFSLPLVVKASSQGSSIGVNIVEKDKDLADALTDAFRYDDIILIEEFIRGKELAVAVWGNEQKASAFPVIEITTLSGRYDYVSKYTKGASTHIIPAQIPQDVTKRVQDLAVRAFHACGCSGIARADLMLADDMTPYVIELNSMPGMTETSLVPDAANAMGIEFPKLCEKILEMAGYGKM